MPGLQGFVKLRNVAERPTGDIVPVALFAFELEVSGIAADARHIYTPERLVDSVGLTMVDPGGLMPGCALLTPAQSCRNTAAVAEAVVTRWEHRRSLHRAVPQMLYMGVQSMQRRIWP